MNRLTVPDVSVIIATKNCPSLHLALLSIEAQTFDNWECIVVDDDSAVPVSTNDLPDDSRFRLFRSEKPLGRSLARNLAVSHAKGRYLAIQDADDFSAPHRLQVGIEALDERPSTVAIGGRFFSFWMNTWADGPQWPLDPEVLRAELLTGRMRIAHPASMIRASAFNEVGGYDARLDRAEDWHLFARLLSLGNLRNIDSHFLAYVHPPREPFRFYCYDFAERQRAISLLRDRKERRYLAHLRAASRYPAYACKIALTRRALNTSQIPAWAQEFGSMVGSPSRKGEIGR